MKTLLEHHYKARIAALADDPKYDAPAVLQTIEKLACENGWCWLCEETLIATKAVNIREA
jgi:hypothetical protein